MSRVTPFAFLDSDAQTAIVNARRTAIRRERLRFLGLCVAIIVLSVVEFVECPYCLGFWVVVGWWMS